jgi:hypothetical protein
MMTQGKKSKSEADLARLCGRFAYIFHKTALPIEEEQVRRAILTIGIMIKMALMRANRSDGLLSRSTDLWGLVHLELSASDVRMSEASLIGGMWINSRYPREDHLKHILFQIVEDWIEKRMRGVLDGIKIEDGPSPSQLKVTRVPTARTG